MAKHIGRPHGVACQRVTPFLAARQDVIERKRRLAKTERSGLRNVSPKLKDMCVFAVAGTYEF